MPNQDLPCRLNKRQSHLRALLGASNTVSSGGLGFFSGRHLLTARQDRLRICFLFSWFCSVCPKKARSPGKNGSQEKTRSNSGHWSYLFCPCHPANKAGDFEPPSCGTLPQVVSGSMLEEARALPGASQPPVLDQTKDGPPPFQPQG